MRTNSLVFLVCLLLVGGVSAGVYGIFQVMSKVDRAIEGKNRLSVHMQHDTKASIMEQPTCLMITLADCDGLVITDYQDPGESYEDFLARFQKKVNHTRANWGK